jgi:hypothetical protein
MTFNQLENGHAVKFKDDSIGMVFKDFMTYDYILDSKGNELLTVENQANSNYRLGPDHKRFKNLKHFNIIEVRSIKEFCNDTFLNPSKIFERGQTIWEYTKPEPIDMTLAEVCKALGKDIKIVQ